MSAPASRSGQSASASGANAHEVQESNARGRAHTEHSELEDRDETTTITTNFRERTTGAGDDETLQSLALNSIWDQGSDSEDDDDATETVVSSVFEASTVATGVTEGQGQGQRQLSPSSASVLAVSAVQAKHRSSFRVYRLDQSGKGKELVQAIEEGDDSQDESETNQTKEPEQHPVNPQQTPEPDSHKRLLFPLFTVACLLSLVSLSVAIGVVSVLFSPTSDRSVVVPSPSPTLDPLAVIQTTIVHAMKELDVVAGEQTAQSFEDKSSRQSLVAQWLADTNTELRRETSQVLSRFALGVCFLQPVDLLDEYKDTADVCTWFIDDRDAGVRCMYNPFPDTFAFDSSQIAATIPPELALLRGLTRINMVSNKLQGTVPPVIGKSLVNLTSLLLDENQLSGPFPPVPSLHNLYIDNNLITSLPNVTYPHLNYLSAAGNDLTGTLDDQISSAPRLIFLKLSRNNMGGALPGAQLCMLYPRIKFLRLGSNEFTGTIPEELFSNCEALEVLDLAWNELSGLHLPPFASSSGLRQLNLSHNRLSGALPFLGKDLPPSLHLLILSHNHFTGPLQPTYAAQLKILKVDKNLLSGGLPHAYLNGTLVQLSIASNRLTGTVPVVQDTRDLQELDLSNNFLRGPLPRILMPNLRKSQMGFLNASHNALTGTLPAPLLEGFTLRHRTAGLDVSFNQLTGTIPPELGRVQPLTKLLLQNNAGLSGTVPRSFADLLQLQELDIRNTGINGTVDFLCFRSGLSIRVDCARVLCSCCEECLE